LLALADDRGYLGVALVHSSAVLGALFVGGRRDLDAAVLGEIGGELGGCRARGGLVCHNRQGNARRDLGASAERGKTSPEAHATISTEKLLVNMRAS
jgi:hypothetical protein